MPPHDEIRGSGRSHLSRALGRTGARVSSVSPPPVVPAGTSSTPEELGVMRWRRRASGRRRVRGRPTEVRPVAPHAVEHDRQLPSDRHDGLLHAPALGYGQPPHPQPRPPAARAGQQHERGLVERGTHLPVPALRDTPDPHRLTGLVEPRRQAVMRPDALRASEPDRVVDAGAVGQRHHQPDPGRGHQPPADRVGADLLQQHLKQLGQLGPQRRVRLQQRQDHGRDEGQVEHEVAHALLEAHRPDDADLEAEVAQLAAQVALDVVGPALQKLARGQEQATLLAGRRLDVNRLERKRSGKGLTLRQLERRLRLASSSRAAGRPAVWPDGRRCG